MKSTKSIIAILMSSFVLLIACNDYVQYVPTDFYSEDDYAIISKDLTLPPNLDNYNVSTSPFGPQNDNMLATLGRVLFYDKDLSADGTISCASCHQQHLAFADEASFSEGVHGNLATRNSIALGALRSFNDEYGGIGEGSPGLFWDERAISVKAQMQETFANPNEMGMDLSRLEGIVESKPYYQTMFEIAHFDGGAVDNKITTDNILSAIEAFVRSLATTGSKFDKVAFDKNEIFTDEGLKRDWVDFSDEENRGKALFSDNCSSCHERSINPFSTNHEGDFREFPLGFRSVANNGLDKIYTDKGVGASTQLTSDNGKFKIPALKNIALTGPYMHDGRFETLGEVLDFYSEGIQDHENLDDNLKDRDRKAIKMNFSAQDKEDLLAFFNTLTDQEMITDSKWSDPFNK